MEKRLCRRDELPQIIETEHLEVVIVLGAGDLNDDVPLFTEILRKK